MSKRVPGSMRTRQSLCDLIEGRPSSPNGRAELVRLAMRLIVEETQSRGRAYYEHGAAPYQRAAEDGGGGVHRYSRP